MSAFLEPIPEIGVCEHDLRHLGTLLREALGINAKGDALEMVEHAVLGIADDLDAIVNLMNEDVEYRIALGHIVGRLRLVAECGQTIAVLSQDKVQP